MTNNIDKILTVICVILLLFSMVFFYYINDAEEKETISDVLSVTRDYSTAGIAANMKAETLYELLYDDNASNDPYVLSIRSVEHYALGHIPGAVNIGLNSLFTEENLAKLPVDKLIVVVCYTGHSASQATALLNAIGFNATALKWGMCGWTTNSTVTVNKCFDQATSAENYPYITGVEPGSMN